MAAFFILSHYLLNNCMAIICFDEIRKKIHCHRELLKNQYLVLKICFLPMVIIYLHHLF